MKILLVPYRLWRNIICTIGVFSYRKLGIQPSHFLYIVCLIDVGKIIYDYLERTFSWFVLAPLMVHMILFVLKTWREGQQDDDNLNYCVFTFDNTSIYTQIMASYIIIVLIGLSLVIGGWYISIQMMLIGFLYLDIYGNKASLFTRRSKLNLVSDRI